MGKKKNTDKTNVMRILDAHKISYEMYDYLDTGAVNGEEVANAMGEDPKQVFKTLVTVSSSKNYYVFLVPVCEALDLKKAARAVGVKKVEMLPSKELLPLTGYIHGGCSPIGMKKFFPTVIDSHAKDYKKIFFSGGKVGFQVEVSLEDLEKVISFVFEDVTV